MKRNPTTHKAPNDESKFLGELGVTEQPSAGVDDLEWARRLYRSEPKQRILRHLSVHGWSARIQIVEGTGIADSVLGDHLGELLRMRAIVTDLPPEQRRGRSVRYAVDRERVISLGAALLDHTLPESASDDKAH